MIKPVTCVSPSQSATGRVSGDWEAAESYFQGNGNVIQNTDQPSVLMMKIFTITNSMTTFIALLV